MKKYSSKGVEEIIRSIDGIAPAAAPEYFYNKLRNRMENTIAAQASPKLLMRPAIVIAALFVCVVMNIFLITKQSKSRSDLVAPEQTGLSSFSEEYGLNSSSN